MNYSPVSLSKASFNQRRKHASTVHFITFTADDCLNLSRRTPKLHNKTENTPFNPAITRNSKKGHNQLLKRLALLKKLKKDLKFSLNTLLKNRNNDLRVPLTKEQRAKLRAQSLIKQRKNVTSIGNYFMNYRNIKKFMLDTHIILKAKKESELPNKMGEEGEGSWKNCAPITNKMIIIPRGRTQVRNYKFGNFLPAHQATLPLILEHKPSAHKKSSMDISERGRKNTKELSGWNEEVDDVYFDEFCDELRMTKMRNKSSAL
eukprot:TRINITY_DN1980_c0_g1_i2.p1 TRINITY_DN1980_c0_g1~~TRINITY_DN1980_c0_g1_i2.p1  ORF type:complete len:261 (+),score=43.77 TRINITY_DN1980_c0_g1_i2:170-952(+)